MDRAGGRVSESLGVLAPGGGRAPGELPPGLDREPGRSVHPRPAHRRGTGTPTRGVAANADSAGGIRPDGSATHAGRNREVRAGRIAAGIRGHGRSVPRLPAVRRRDGPALARCGAVRRHARAASRQRARDVGLPRLGGGSLQPEPAIRPVHNRAIGGRSTAQPNPRPTGGDGIQPLQCDDK